MKHHIFSHWYKTDSGLKERSKQIKKSLFFQKNTEKQIK